MPLNAWSQILVPKKEASKWLKLNGTFEKRRTGHLMVNVKDMYYSISLEVEPITARSIWSEVQFMRNWKDFFPFKTRNFKLWKMPK